MKRIALWVLCVLMLFVAGQREAEAVMPVDSFIRTLERLAGTWYDEEGRAVLTIAGRTINGCEVIAGDNLANGPGSGSLDFIVREAAGTRALRIGWMLLGGPADFVTLGDGEALQRTLNPACAESVSGTRLGMRTHAVRQMLGEGKELSREEPCRAGDMSFSQGLYYPDKRLIVFREKGIVTGLVLLRGSKLRFERSGLTANDSRKAYARAYRLPQIPEESSRSMTAVYSIALGENLSFGLNGSYVMLSIYEN